MIDLRAFTSALKDRFASNGPMFVLSRLRRSQQTILALFAVAITGGFLAQTTGHRILSGFLFALSILGVLGLLAFLLIRPLARKLLWRVRNRLLVTYFLAGAVPVVLLLLFGSNPDSVFQVVNYFRVALDPSRVDAKGGDHYKPTSGQRGWRLFWGLTSR